MSCTSDWPFQWQRATSTKLAVNEPACGIFSQQSCSTGTSSNISSREGTQDGEMMVKLGQAQGFHERHPRGQRRCFVYNVKGNKNAFFTWANHYLWHENLLHLVEGVIQSCRSADVQKLFQLCSCDLRSHLIELLSQAHCQIFRIMKWHCRNVSIQDRFFWVVGC